jgi:hypothetical protein
MIKELRRQNPKFRHLSISAGDHPSLEADEKECQDLNAKHEWAAYTIQNFGDPDNRAYVSLCDGGLRYPSLQDILDEDKAGPGCDALGPDETGLMTSLGGQILHEMVHWRYLLRDVPDFQENLLDYLNEEVEEDEWIITDFDGGDSSHLSQATVMALFMLVNWSTTKTATLATMPTTTHGMRRPGTSSLCVGESLVRRRRTRITIVSTRRHKHRGVS